MRRRSLLKLPAVIPVIGLIDYSDWTANTVDGLPDDLEWRKFGFSDLVTLDSVGPYLRFAWLDWSPGDTLPTVRAMCWVSDRDMYEAVVRVGIDFGEGYQNYDVTKHIDIQERWPHAPVEKEALMRAIRVIIREHYGYGTLYTT